jgi:mRNA-degrading endonuclease RelE of RelBE toxin-antitoxin system
LVLVETGVFSRQIDELLHPESYRRLQVELVDSPDRGALIPGTGGLRKIRWPVSGHGKRGGMRVIYYWAPDRGVILLLLAYAKAERDDLTVEQARLLRRVVEKELG